MEKSFGEALGDLERGPTSAAADEGAPAGDAGDIPEHATVSALRERFGDAVLHHAVVAGDEHVVYLAADRLLDVMGWLQSEPSERYDFLADVTAVDYGGGRPLEVVYQLWSIPHKRALRIKVTLPLSALDVDSVYGIWSAADWLEREVFDLFGIQFRGHPDLRRILMPENYAEGHPLRKDFPLRGRFSRAEQTRRSLALGVEDYYTPEELRLARQLGEEEIVERARALASLDEGAATSRDVSEAAAEATAAAAHAPRAKHAEEWSLGSPESAAGGAPAPRDASSGRGDPAPPNAPPAGEGAQAGGSARSRNDPGGSESG